MLNNANRPVDLLKILLTLLFLILLIASCFWVIQPFILGFTWAGMVVIATWPLLLWLQKIFGGKRFFAVIVMTLLLLVVFVTPIFIMVNSIIDNSAPLLAWASDPDKWQIPQMSWLNDIPMVGESLYSGWQRLTSGGGANLFNAVKPYIGQSTTWFVAQAAHFSRFFLHCVLMVLFSVLLYSQGDKVAEGIRRFAYRLVQDKGEMVVLLAAQSIRAVALGVVVTALVQSILGGIGLTVVSIPYAMLLTVIMFISCVAQLGVLPVLVPAVIWLYWTGDTTWGTVLLVWTVIVATLDNILRPVLIRMGADLPLLLILSGVIGGLLAFGMIGLFIGPVVLAVSYRLLAAWIGETPPPTKPITEVLPESDEKNA